MLEHCPRKLFSSAGALNTSGLCGYNHVMVGPRIDTSRLGVPPIDLYGFARSAAYNPTYYNPRVVYDPWIKEDGKESWGMQARLLHQSTLDQHIPQL